MSTTRKPYIATGLLRVLLFDGVTLLVLFPAPLGLWAAYEARTEGHLDWFWVAIVGVAMAAATALIGGLFLWLGSLIVKRRIKGLGYGEIENDA